MRSLREMDATALKPWSITEDLRLATRVLWIAVIAPACVLGDQARYVALGFGEQQAWQITASEPWWALVDLRDMLNLFHPLSIPTTGHAAGASRAVSIPADWRGPIVLRFYCADDYFADAAKHKSGQPGTESFFEHRFKQVLIDETVIWERDVVDENTLGSPTVFEVDVTPYVAPGRSFRLTFRVLDKISTQERNARDVWFRSGTWYAPGASEKEEAPRFHTAVWFADPVIGEREATGSAPAGVRPHDEVVRVRHERRWPMVPRGIPLRFPSEFKLVTPTTIPAPGFPITCGIPMPPGLMTDEQRLELMDHSGRPLPRECQIAARWPDGSVRHAIVTAVAPAGSENGSILRLSSAAGPAPGTESQLKILRESEVVKLDTGPLRLRLGSQPSHLIDEILLADGSGPVCDGIVARLRLQTEQGSEAVDARWESVAVVEAGPVAACVVLKGTLEVGTRRIGRFIFRLYTYAGLATIRTQFRVINDVKGDEPLKITDVTLVAGLPGGLRGVTTAGVLGGEPLRSISGPISLHQHAPEQFTARVGANGSINGKQAEGWIAASGEHGRIQASVRRFWPQYPMGLSAIDDRIEIGLFTPSAKLPAYRPNYGESKRHDVWFTFSPRTNPPEVERAIALLAESPPRLFDGRWFCLSGAFAVLDPSWFEHQPRIATWVEAQYGDVSRMRVLGGNYGIREFGDLPYGGDGQWMNGYWAMIQGSLYWGLASGDARWIERSDEIARHIVDVDCVRIAAGNADWDAWNGVMCALGKDHSVHEERVKWPAFQQGENLLLHYWMTGDPDSREAGLANADYIVRSRAGVGSAEARSQARPMLTLLRAWQTTGTVAYLEAARRYLDLKTQTEHVIEWRRGAYIQPTYENHRCISAGLDSMYAHNIYEYYRLTGDLDAARLVVAVADSVYAESMLPQEEGIGSFIFYPRYSRGSWYYTQMAMLFHMAYDLTEDVRFLRAGRAAFERYLHSADAAGNPVYQSWGNFGWLDPEFGGWLLEFKDVPAAPLHITGQTPEPDPANYQ